MKLLCINVYYNEFLDRHTRLEKLITLVINEEKVVFEATNSVLCMRSKQNRGPKIGTVVHSPKQPLLMYYFAALILLL